MSGENENNSCKLSFVDPELQGMRNEGGSIVHFKDPKPSAEVCPPEQEGRKNPSMIDYVDHYVASALEGKTWRSKEFEIEQKQGLINLLGKMRVFERKNPDLEILEKKEGKFPRKSKNGEFRAEIFDDYRVVVPGKGELEISTKTLTADEANYRKDEYERSNSDHKDVSDAIMDRNEEFRGVSPDKRFGDDNRRERLSNRRDIWGKKILYDIVIKDENGGFGITEFIDGSTEIVVLDKNGSYLRRRPSKVPFAVNFGKLQKKIYWSIRKAKEKQERASKGMEDTFNP